MKIWTSVVLLLVVIELDPSEAFIKKLFKNNHHTSQNCEIRWETEMSEEPHCTTTHEQKCETLHTTHTECSIEYTTECQTEKIKQCKIDHTKQCTNETVQQCTTEHTEECWEETEKVCTTKPECTSDNVEMCSTTYQRVCPLKKRTRREAELDRNVAVVRKMKEQMSAEELLNMAKDVALSSKAEHSRKRRGLIGLALAAKHLKAAAAAKPGNNFLTKLLGLDQNVVGMENVVDDCHDVPNEHCASVPVEKCHDVQDCQDKPATKCKEVPHEKCWDEIHENCWDEPQETCWDEPHEKCWEEPHEKCWQVPDEKCWEVPNEQCEHILVRVARRWCDDNNGKTDKKT
eukprot:GFUD01074153.1.p1 GENE.GFUD01074153.1~~GFUD01074153.1.p1  ORF type:complete len:345 (+),score=57.63 GFUD01074153.1:73-1107(+)